ncbi:DALR anticodon-binding domain-containing protein 3 [Anthonomus grandis grandis]|uniref:DALR anticodon-binding domain-containing protein 3 n=1 Tax=Anthonomus grandis grandis TaxID=2921223 RepID=UPI002165DE57|nr:DALR anticodon-binding domain-containing protein 3 [Anthonomus grandis grandis]
MYILKSFIDEFYDILINQVPKDDETLVKMHTRYLEELGDVSFPIPLKNWYHLVKRQIKDPSETIFEYRLNKKDVNEALETIVNHFNEVSNVKIKSYKVIKSCAHLFIQRPYLISLGIKQVLEQGNNYPEWTQFSKQITLASREILENEENLDITTLRLQILKNVLTNLLSLTTDPNASEIIEIEITETHKANSNRSTILCGPVISENGSKNTESKASDFFKKRVSDMQMMAQHKYRMNIKSSTEYHDFFSKLGRASVTIELLTNKPHKPVKVSLNDLSGANKGSAFIFYNCARLNILLKEFDSKVKKNVYPMLVDLNNIDFSLLSQPEEWELLYVYIVQYPFTIRNCIRTIEKGIVNTQNLITYLSGLSSVFSVYYRRVRILTDARDHMIPVIHSRIYLLKALQVVFHNALQILNIEPITEM